MKSRDMAKDIIKKLQQNGMVQNYYDIENESVSAITNTLDYIEMCLLRKLEEGTTAADLQLRNMKLLYEKT
jgi:hypothetical protein